MNSPEQTNLELVSRREAIKTGFRRGLGLAILTGAVPTLLRPQSAQAAATTSPATRAIDKVLQEVEVAQNLGVRFPKPFTPTTRAEEYITWVQVGIYPGALNQGLWLPFAPQDGQIVAHEPGEFLDKTGAIANSLGLTVDGHAADPRGWEEQYANESLSQGGVSWRGHCHGGANMIAFHEQLVIDREGSFDYQGQNITYNNVIGLRIYNHSKDAQIATRSDLEGMKALLQVCKARGWAAVINGSQIPGQVWRYAVIEVTDDNRFVKGYNFGKELIFPVSEISDMYLPGDYNPTDPASVESAALIARRPTLGYINEELADYNLLRYIALNVPYGQPLP